MYPLHSVSALLQSVFRDQQRNSLWQKQGSHLTSPRNKIRLLPTWSDKPARGKCDCYK